MNGEIQTSEREKARFPRELISRVREADTITICALQMQPAALRWLVDMTGQLSSTRAYMPMASAEARFLICPDSPPLYLRLFPKAMCHRIAIVAVGERHAGGQRVPPEKFQSR